MESTNRVDEYIKATKDMSSESITDMIYDIDENISNIEKDIMDKVSKNEDASALMEQVQEESLRRHIYKYILARRKSNTASKKWENFKEKFIINSEQENIYNNMRNSQKDFEIYDTHVQVVNTSTGSTVQAKNIADGNKILKFIKSQEDKDFLEDAARELQK